MSYVKTETADGVAVVTLNDPDKRNALNLDMVGEVGEAMDAIEADESVGAVVVTGEPPAFCAGNGSPPGAWWPTCTSPTVSAPPSARW